MATTFNLYDEWREIVADPTRASAISGTLKLAIVTASYTPDQALHDFWDDVSANEVSGTGYTAGGNSCASPTWTDGGAGGTLTFDASDPATWSQNAAGFSTGRRAILYYDTGTGSTSRLVGYSDDFGAASGNVAGDFTVTFNASGIYTSPR
jgi:hypothetical protein